MDILIAIVIGVIIAFVITGVQKSALKTVEKQSAASEYIKQGSFKLNMSNDVFLYKKIEKVEKERK